MLGGLDSSRKHSYLVPDVIPGQRRASKHGFYVQLLCIFMDGNWVLRMENPRGFNFHNIDLFCSCLHFVVGGDLVRIKL